MRVKTVVCTLILLGLTLIVVNPQVRLWLVYFQEAVGNTIHPYSPPPLPAGFNPILQHGDIITARTRSAEVRIKAIDDHTRRYQWRTLPEGKWNTEIVSVIPNDLTGTLYNPGNTSENISTFLRLRKSLMVWEGEADFSNEQELEIELKNYFMTHGAVYSNSGLLVGISLERPDFIILQLKVNGQIPKDLKGANNSVTRSSAENRRDLSNRHE
ncbi:MAG: hypothetical protein K2X93_28050 [Candidatus Obscuribacterales bacterium]|nr:hypothetical protein [Candidatus Obscuribacterales bacterium]